MLLSEPMKKHTTFRIGGPADYFLMPQSEKEAADAVAVCREEQVPYSIVGNGSNLLVSDSGYRGVVIQLYKEMSRVQTEGTHIYAQAGASLAKVAAAAMEAGLAGFEFAAGIPGTLGGACVMNAGAYGGEMKDVLANVTVLDESGRIRKLAGSELELGYRTSIIAKKGYIVLGAEIELTRGNLDEIRGLMNELRDKRVSKQPLEYPSAGSTFKRPEGYFAGKLIQDAGLRGKQIGGAQVSEKHCGFIINRDHASAQDIWELCACVVNEVRAQFKVELEMEVRVLGRFSGS